jgi:hypothetical protein
MTSLVAAAAVQQLDGSAGTHLDCAAQPIEPGTKICNSSWCKGCCFLLNWIQVHLATCHDIQPAGSCCNTRPADERTATPCYSTAGIDPALSLHDYVRASHLLLVPSTTGRGDQGSACSCNTASHVNTPQCCASMIATGYSIPARACHSTSHQHPYIHPGQSPVKHPACLPLCQAISQQRPPTRLTPQSLLMWMM